MNSYLKPLRRKFGVATLVMTCLFTAGWIRSRLILDQVVYIRDQYNQGIFQSVNGSLVWISETANIPNYRSLPTLEWNGGHPASDEFFIPDNPNPKSAKSEWQFRGPGFGVGHLANIMNRKKFCFASYWLLTIPLTLLSTWLLLSKLKQAKPSIELSA